NIPSLHRSRNASKSDGAVTPWTAADVQSDPPRCHTCPPAAHHLKGKARPSRRESKYTPRADEATRLLPSRAVILLAEVALGEPTASSAAIALRAEPKAA